MKVICIRSTYDRPTTYGDHKMDLTTGKIYDVIHIDENHTSDGERCYRIANDRGATGYYSHGRFLIPLNDYILQVRQEKLNQLELDEV